MHLKGKEGVNVRLIVMIIFCWWGVGAFLKGEEGKGRSSTSVHLGLGGSSLCECANDSDDARGNTGSLSPQTKRIKDQNKIFSFSKK